MMMDRKEFDPGFIDSVTHALTGAQVLYHMLHTWESQPRLPIIIWCLGDAGFKADSIRVALSRERKANNAPRTFELRFSEPWKHTHMGVRGEAIKVTRELGRTTTRIQAAMQRMNRST